MPTSAQLAITGSSAMRQPPCSISHVPIGRNTSWPVAALAVNHHLFFRPARGGTLP